MILHQNTRDIQRSGIKVEREATIVADAVAFKVLSDMLYPDKPLAIIRELLCNAMDSHIAAGKPLTPVKIHLPNIMEPYLSIRDEGLGLSFRDTCVLLLTYFKSTKRADNQVTGALGLGSKSPFSYVDSYTVTSRFNGRMFMFNAFINEAGNPSMALLAKARTDEPNGLEITVPVRRSDFQTFHQRAAAVIQWFKVKPEVSGAPGFAVRETKYVEEGADWKISEYNHYDHNAMAVQGNIAYPINSNSMPELPKGYASLFNMGIHFEFKIGDISFTAGRDAISYDKKTVSNLVAAMDRFINDAPKKFQQQFDNCKTLWEAKCKYHDLISSQGYYSVVGEMGRMGLLAFNWQGQKVKNSTLSLEMKNVPASTIKSFYFGRGVRTYQATGNKILELQGENTVKFFVNDMAKGSVVRVREWRKANENEYNSVYVIQAGDASELKIILDSLGNPETQLTSTLPKPVRATTVSRTTVRVLNIDWHGDTVYRTPTFTDCHEDLDFDEGGLYVPLLRDKAIDAQREKIAMFQTIVQEAYNMGILTKDEVVYGASPKVLPQFAKSEDWVNVLDVIKERFQAKVEKENLMDKIATYANWTAWNGNSEGYQAFRSLTQSNNSYFKNRLGSDHPLTAFQDHVLVGRKLAMVADKNDMMARLLNIDVTAKAGKPEYDYVGAWKAIVAKYPMIKVMHYPQGGDEALLLEYIKTMDKLA
jgi:hypothetical protein